MRIANASLRDRRPAVLVLEDDALIAMDVETTLADVGYAVFLAGSNKEAHAFAARACFDCALLDVELQDGDCADLARALRQAKVPFAVTTGLRERDLDHEVLRDAPLIQKPFRAEVLIAVVHRILVGNSPPLASLAMHGAGTL